jgi:hypothetical protein
MLGAACAGRRVRDALLQQVQGALQIRLDLVQLGIRGVGGEGFPMLAEEAEGAA